MLERVSKASKLTWFDADKCFIDGRWVKAQSGRSLPIEDPSRGIEIGEIARGTAADIDTAVEAASARFMGPGGVSRRPSGGGCWRSLPILSARGSTISRESRRPTSASR
jgi:hypothetical protein